MRLLHPDVLTKGLLDLSHLEFATFNAFEQHDLT